MTPKEKAKEVVDKMMYHLKYNCQPTLSEMVAKQCALIAVDELIKNKIMWQNGEVTPVFYWIEVKKEIKLL